MTFREQLLRIHKLPYGRISKPNEPDLVVQERRGTCSSKHAYAAKCAAKMGIKSFELFFGVFLLDAVQFPELTSILGRCKIPEVHCFAKWENEHWDITFPNANPNQAKHQYYKIESIDLGTLLNGKKEFHLACIEEYNHPKSEIERKNLWLMREKCIALWSK